MLIPAFLLMAGCAAHQPVSQNWRLMQRQSARVLVPPGVVESRAGYALDVAVGRAKCPPEIRAKRKHVIVAIDADSLQQRPAGWLTSWAGELESQGCIARGEAAKFAESLPLDSRAAFRLLHPDDIEPPVRVQVISAIQREDDAADGPVNVSSSGNGLTVTMKAPALRGYETTLYAVQPKPSGPGFHLTPLYAERHIRESAERVAKPAEDYLQFPPEAAFYRLILKSDQTDFTALVLAAADRPGLDGSVTSCPAKDRMCIGIPRLVAINEVVPVTVNGAEIMVRWGANVAEAIPNSRGMRRETLLEKLSILRPYRGRLAVVEFDRGDPAILGLVLEGGEVISW